MFDFERPNIEVAEISEDKKYGQVRGGASGKRIWNYPGQFAEKNHVVFLTRCSS